MSDTPAEAVAKAARLDPTVILMDIRMPELDGLEATRRIIAAVRTVGSVPPRLKPELAAPDACPAPPG